MVAAEQDRRATGREFRADGFHHHAVPCDDLAEMAITVVRRLPRIARAVEVAAIDDVHATRRQRFRKTGDAQGFGTQARAAMACADIGGRPDQRHAEGSG